MFNYTMQMFSLLFLCTMISIISLNANGLRNQNKIQSLFTLFNEYKYDIICLQETFWDDNFISYVKTQWSGKLFVSNCTELNRRGVAVLLKKNIDVNVIFQEGDMDGRLLHLKIDVVDCIIDIFNVYAPNDIRERKAFFQMLNSYVTPGCNNYIIGDWNMYSNKYLDACRTSSMRNDSSRIDYDDLLSNLNLIDIYRHVYPDKKEFTWRRRVGNVLQQSRLDRFLISSNMLNYCKDTYVFDTSLSDHSIIYLRCDFSGVEIG